MRFSRMAETVSICAMKSIQHRLTSDVHTGYKWPGATDINLSGRGLDVLLSEYLEANNPYTPFVAGRIKDESAPQVVSLSIPV